MKPGSKAVVLRAETADMGMADSEVVAEDGEAKTLSGGVGTLVVIWWREDPLLFVLLWWPREKLAVGAVGW